VHESVEDIPYLEVEGGFKIQTTAELVNWLQRIDDRTFNAHVYNEKNDFSSWVYHILKEHELGMKLYQTKSRSDTIRVIEEHLKTNGLRNQEHASELLKEMDFLGKNR